MRRLFTALLLIGASFAAGLIVVNYIVMPLLVDREDVAEVPAVVGLDLDRARDHLKEEGLEFGVMGETFSEEMPAGFVISQSPGAGLLVKRGRTVQVLVSLGEETVMVPDVVGFKAPQARILLERAGLAPGVGQEEVSEVVARGGVIRTDPPAKVRVPRGTDVELAISLGRTTIDMPLLEGRSVAEARRILSAMELRITRVDSVASRDVRPGIVLGQKPSPGSRVVGGQDVELTVSAGAPR